MERLFKDIMQDSPCLFEILKLHPETASCLGELPYFTYSAIFFSIMKVLAGHVAQIFIFSLRGAFLGVGALDQDQKAAG